MTAKDSRRQVLIATARALGYKKVYVPVGLRVTWWAERIEDPNGDILAVKTDEHEPDLDLDCDIVERHMYYNYGVYIYGG